MADLAVDPDRVEFTRDDAVEAAALRGLPMPGIFVRAKLPDGKWASVDIVALDKASLLAWLRSRGGENPWAEDVVGILLGHGHLHSEKT